MKKSASKVDRVEVWTDGCFNKRLCGWAVVCPSQKLILRGKILGGTNQRAELLAIVHALQYFGSDLIVHTDSKYSIGCLDGGWNPTKNLEIIQMGLDLGSTKVEYRHVFGHSGDTYNEMADGFCNGKLLSDSLKSEGWKVKECEDDELIGM